MIRRLTSKRTIYSLLLIEIILIVVVTTLTYLPNLTRATIYRDDWYYALDRTLGGPQAFHDMFHIDRPARGYFFEIYYRLFGVEPAPYHLAGFGWRVLMGLSALWLFLLLWPKQRNAALLIAIFFVLYPGYTRWMEGFEDQPKVVSLFLQVTSIALTLRALKATRPLARAGLWAASILTGWGYLALIDYAMGMEVFRYLCIFAFTNRGRGEPSLIKKGLVALRAGFPAVLVLAGFLFWRVFLFHNERPETDIKLQLKTVIESPLVQGSWWLVHFFQSMVNDAVLAWASNPFQDLFKMSLGVILLGLLVAAVVVACVVLGLFWMDRSLPAKAAPDSPNQRSADEPAAAAWSREALWIGLLGVAAGVVPVVMANRSIEFGILSHYSLPASLASATLLVGLVYSIAQKRLQVTAIAVLVMLAVLTQYIASEKVAREEEIIGKFWQQVVWRAPGIREATGLMVNYPSVVVGEDVDSVHGPANYIYYPQPVNELPVRYKLFAAKMYPWTVKEYLAGGKTKVSYRSHYGVIDYGYLLVISQPSVDACVHVIDQQWPWYSYNDPDMIMLVGPGSNVRNILPKATPPKLSASIFGLEPDHGWCYYFEKAELALQQKDWETVRALGDEAARLKLEPSEPLEWMPFLQAYAFLGDGENFEGTAAKLNTNAYNQAQSCGVLHKMQKLGYAFPSQTQSLFENGLCGSPNP